MTGVPGIQFANTNGTCSSAANCYPQWNWTGGTEGARMNDHRRLPPVQRRGDLADQLPTQHTAATQQGTPVDPQLSPARSGWQPDHQHGSLHHSIPVQPDPRGRPALRRGREPVLPGQRRSRLKSSTFPAPASTTGHDLREELPAEEREAQSPVPRGDLQPLQPYPVQPWYNIQPQYDWRNWLPGHLVQTNADLNRFNGTLNPRQMSMSLRLVF